MKIFVANSKRKQKEDVYQIDLANYASSLRTWAINDILGGMSACCINHYAAAFDFTSYYPCVKSLHTKLI